MDTKVVGAIYADVKALDTSDPSGAFEAILSTTMVDRDGEIVEAGAFEPLPKAIPIHVNHEFMDVSKVVGRGEPYYDGNVLRVKGVFASTPEAQMVRSLVAEGMVQTMSVGYLRPEYDTSDEIPRIKSADLIEASFVSVPANSEALVSMVKHLAHADAKAGARNSASDGDRLQQIHDLAVSNGAKCVTEGAEEPKSPDADPVEKSAAAPAPAGAAADNTPSPDSVTQARLAALRAEAELLLIA